MSQAIPRIRRTVMISIMALALGLTGCATTTPSNKPILLAGWEATSRPLFYQGPGIAIGTGKWRVSPMLAKGTYRLLSHKGDVTEVLDGYGFEFDGNPAKEIFMLLPMQYSDVEAVEAKFIAPH